MKAACAPRDRSPTSTLDPRTDEEIAIAREGARASGPRADRAASSRAHRGLCRRARRAIAARTVDRLAAPQGPQGRRPGARHGRRTADLLLHRSEWPASLRASGGRASSNRKMTMIAPIRRRSTGHRAAARDGRRLRHHGRERASGGNAGVALLANAIATGGALYVLILGLGPISGAHFNPLVSLIEAAFRRLPRAQLPGYLVAQFAGAFAGVVLAHAMFNLDLVQSSTHVRSTHGELIGEVGRRVRAVARDRDLEPRESGEDAGARSRSTSSARTGSPRRRRLRTRRHARARRSPNTFAGIRLADVAPFIGSAARRAARVGGGAHRAGCWRADRAGRRPRRERACCSCVSRTRRAASSPRASRVRGSATASAFRARARKPTQVNPYAIEVMAERKLDITSHTSKLVDEIDPSGVDLVVTLCAEEVCPVFLRPVRRLHWPIRRSGDQRAAARDRDAARFRAAEPPIAARLDGLEAALAMPPRTQMAPAVPTDRAEIEALLRAGPSARWPRLTRVSWSRGATASSSGCRRSRLRAGTMH